MKVLMFGWEFPPKICGGLAVVSYGAAKELSLQGDVEATFCMSKPSGEKEKFLKVIGMDQVPVVWRDINYDYLKSHLLEMIPEEYYSFRDHVYADFFYMYVNDLGCMEFASGYPGNLYEEINNLSVITGVTARQQGFDITHAYDQLTYPAGVHIKTVSGKPLCIHVHVTDFDRSRGRVSPTVYSIEKSGIDHADCIMRISKLTRRTVINEYRQDPRKVSVMHNAVYPLSQELLNIPCLDHPKERVVTFLGRITTQKGPEYFVEAAALVLRRTRNIRFVTVGSGDTLNTMTNLVAECGIADRFHFPGFMKGKQVYEVYKSSDVFVMPSVSELFDTAPLEAMQYGIPSIVSKQPGCGEIPDKVIKTDYQGIHAMVDAIHSLCTSPSLFEYPKEEGKKEVDGITWEKVGLRIRALYEAALRDYGR